MPTQNFFTRLLGPTLGLLTGLLVAGAALLLWQTPRGVPVTILPPGPSPTPNPARVYISGAVHKPGVYTLPPDSIAADALAAAGGALAEADLTHINLAQPLYSGTALYVPRQGEAPPAPVVSGPDPAVPAPTLPTGPLDLNTATAEALDQLPKIGPTTAQNIVAYRTAHGGFKTIDELNEVKGIGDTTLAAIRDLVCICSPAP